MIEELKQRWRWAVYPALAIVGLVMLLIIVSWMINPTGYPIVDALDEEAMMRLR